MQGGIGKDFLQTVKFRFVARIQDTGFCNTADNGLFHSAVCLQGYQHRQIVMLPVLLLYDLIVKALHYRKAAVHFSLIQHTLGQIGLKGTEDIPSTEVNPHRIFPGGGFHLVPVKDRKDIVRVAPRLWV